MLKIAETLGRQHLVTTSAARCYMVRRRLSGQDVETENENCEIGKTLNGLFGFMKKECHQTLGELDEICRVCSKKC